MSDWPDGLKTGPIGEWPSVMTSRRTLSPFSATLTSTLALLRRELRELDAKNTEMLIAISPGAFTLAGRPYANAKPDHPGIILSFDTSFGHLSYPADQYTTWQDNLRAVALSLEALRKVDRYGVTKRSEQYRGFLAIEARAAGAFTSDEAAMRFLGEVAEMIVDPNLEMVAAYETGARRRIAAKALFHSHPDRGGDRDVYDKALAAQEHLRSSGLL